MQAPIFHVVVWMMEQNPVTLHDMKRGTRKALANFARQWREYRHMTQEQLAEASHLSLSTVNKIENQTAGFSPESIAAIAEALGCSIGDLLSIDASNELDMALWEVLRTLSDDQKRQLVRIGEAIKNDWRRAQ